MATFFDPTRNFSFYAIPSAWVLSILPHFYAVSLYDRSSSQKFDNRYPAASPRKSLPINPSPRQPKTAFFALKPPSRTASRTSGSLLPPLLRAMLPEWTTGG